MSAPDPTHQWTKDISELLLTRVSFYAGNQHLETKWYGYDEKTGQQVLKRISYLPPEEDTPERKEEEEKYMNVLHKLYDDKSEEKSEEKTNGRQRRMMKKGKK